MAFQLGFLTGLAYSPLPTIVPSVLHNAAWADDTRAAAAFLENKAGRICVDAALQDGATPLHLAAVAGARATAALLLAAGAATDRADRDGQMPLHAAASAGDEGVCELLLSAGACPDAKDLWGYDPLRWAALNGHAEVVRLLLSYGAAAHAVIEGLSPLALAAAAGHMDVVAVLVDAGERDGLAVEVATAAGHDSIAYLLGLVHEDSSQVVGASAQPAPLAVRSLDAAILASERHWWDSAFSSSTPLHLRGVGNGWAKQIAGWSVPVLQRRWGEAEVTVAFSPDNLYQRPFYNYGEPAARPAVLMREVPQQRMRLRSFLDLLPRHGLEEYFAVSQSASDGAFAEFAGLPSQPPALRGLLPESVNRCNLWVCRPPKLSALHYDSDDSILVQIAGTKRFTLVAPGPLLGLTPHPTKLPVEALERVAEGVYAVSDGEEAVRERDETSDGTEGEAPRLASHFPLVNVTNPDLERHPLFRFARVTTVEVHEGEALLLPAYWYHEVESFAPTPNAGGEDAGEGEGGAGLNIAVNYWFDAQVEGGGLPSQLHRILRAKLVTVARDGVS